MEQGLTVTSSIPMAFVQSEDVLFDDKRYIKLDFRLCHDGENPNRSDFDISDIEKEKDTCKNIPILANILEDEDEELNFGGHDFHIEPNKVTKNPEDLKIVYDETIVGIIPETNNWRIQEYNGKNYAYVTGYIFKDYSNYCEDLILQNDEHKISMEIDIDKYSVNAKRKKVHVTDFTFRGVTILNPSYGTGMKDARATLNTYSAQLNNECFSAMIADLNASLNSFTQNKQEGGLPVDDTTVITPDATTSAEEANFDNTTEEVVTADNTDTTGEIDASQNTQDADPVGMEENNENATNEQLIYSKTFTLSHEDIRYALYTLLEGKEAEDNEWYFIENVYDEYFEYSNFEGTKHFRQGYVKNADLVELNGDAISLFYEKLTTEEKAVLDAMRNSFSSMEAELNDLKTYKENIEKAEVDSQKEAILSKWAVCIGNDNATFIELQESKDKYSLEELEKECKCIFADTKATFQENKPKEQTTIRFSLSSTEVENDEPYGGLFKEFGNKK